MPHNAFRMVVLPAPFGPRSPVTEPLVNVIDTFEHAVILFFPLPYVFVNEQSPAEGDNSPSSLFLVIDIPPINQYREYQNAFCPSLIVLLGIRTLPDPTECQAHCPYILGCS